MKNRRWLAAFTAVVAVFLLIEGGWTVWTINAVRELEVLPGTPFATAEDVVWAKSYLPAMYVVAFEGLLFGAIAIVCAVGMITGKSWAPRVLRVASVFLALTAVVAIGMAPQKWDTQGIFILFCILLWWESKKWRHE